MVIFRGKMQILRFAESGCSFLFPPICHVCSSALDTIKSSRPREIDICDQCLSDILNLDSNRCKICSAIIGPNLNSDAGCYYCQSDNYLYGKVTTIGTHENLLQQAILRGKLGYDVVILQSLTKLLFNSFRDRILSTDANVIIPIPHHWRDRLLYRSQASNTISSYLGKLLNVSSSSHILRKTKKTTKQHNLSPAERRKNLRSAFRVNSKVHLKGARILLVDDVVTTGTTCQRATQELLKAGAEIVHVAALARGIGA